jgi:hypothetical protein
MILNFKSLCLPALAILYRLWMHKDVFAYEWLNGMYKKRIVHGG